MAITENTIVVGVDGSPASTIAVQWGANTAVKRQAPLHLVASYVMPQFLYAEGMAPPQDLFDELEDETLAKINEAKAAAHELFPDLAITHEIREARPIDLLLKLSKEVGMIVLGSRGLGGLSGMVMGSVSSAVVSHAECPVVVVREDSKLTDDNKYGPVVVGVDGSKVSQKAVALAFTEAAARGAELIAVHTWMDVQVQASLAGLTTAQAQWEEIEAEQYGLVDQELKPFTDQYPDVTVTKLITRDRPVRALVDAAAHAQLLVVGSHGRGGFRGMVLGSTSRALLQSAPCPMMVVRPESHNF